MPEYHLAQANVARMRGPLDSPVMTGFVARLAEINALADAAPGFVWRLQTGDGDATSIRAFDDERILLNLSVWESAEALRDYVYQSRHQELLRQRRDWFETMDPASVVLWWTPVGHRPGVSEGVERLDQLRRNGPGPAAFTFRARFPAPGNHPAGPPTPGTDQSPAPDR